MVKGQLAWISISPIPASSLERDNFSYLIDRLTNLDIDLEKDTQTYKMLWNTNQFHNKPTSPPLPDKSVTTIDSHMHTGSKINL
eukprot:c1489_g1_i1 orf=56-307(-)